MYLCYVCLIYLYTLLLLLLLLSLLFTNFFFFFVKFFFFFFTCLRSELHLYFSVNVLFKHLFEINFFDTLHKAIQGNKSNEVFNS